MTTGDTKTSAGTRKIVLPSSTASLLSKRRASALTEWIFPNPLKPEQPANPDTAYSHLKLLLKWAGLPSIRFHDLRHTFATLALQNGVDIKTVSSMPGHYDAVFTLRTYTHATRQQQNRSAETMGFFMAQVMQGRKSDKKTRQESTTSCLVLSVPFRTFRRVGHGAGQSS